MTGAPVQASIRVLVPATSANLGPGFDCLALALALHNAIEVFPAPGYGSTTVEIAGEGTGILPVDRENLLVRAMHLLAESNARQLPSLHLRLTNAIPLGRGLGSSAAAIVGGLFAAATLLGLPADPASLLPPALRLEGHPDNIAAALYGGLTIGVLSGEGAIVRRIEPPATLQAVLLVPECFASTMESRAVLPATLTRADAIFNAGRCALLVADLAAGRLDDLRIAMEDRVHQPQRAAAFPYLPEAIAAALAAGAHGAALSGAGSSVIALTSREPEAVAAALEGVAVAYHLPARTIILRPEARGVHHHSSEASGVG